MFGTAAMKPRLNSATALPARCSRFPCRNGAVTMSTRLPTSRGRMPPACASARPVAALTSSTIHSSARKATISEAARPSGLASDPSSSRDGAGVGSNGPGRLDAHRRKYARATPDRHPTTRLWCVGPAAATPDRHPATRQRYRTGGTPRPSGSQRRGCGVGPAARRSTGAGRARSFKSAPGWRAAAMRLWCRARRQRPRRSSSVSRARRRWCRSRTPATSASNAACSPQRADSVAQLLQQDRHLAVGVAAGARQAAVHRLAVAGEHLRRVGPAVQRGRPPATPARRSRASPRPARPRPCSPSSSSAPASSSPPASSAAARSTSSAASRAAGQRAGRATRWRAGSRTPAGSAPSAAPRSAAPPRPPAVRRPHRTARAGRPAGGRRSPPRRDRPSGWRPRADRRRAAASRCPGTPWGSARSRPGCRPARRGRRRTWPAARASPAGSSTLSSGGDAHVLRSSDRYAAMPASPSASAKSVSSTTGQPGPSSRWRNSHSASRAGLGRAARARPRVQAQRPPVERRHRAGRIVHSGHRGGDALDRRAGQRARLGRVPGRDQLVDRVQHLARPPGVVAGGLVVEVAAHPQRLVQLPAQHRHLRRPGGRRHAGTAAGRAPGRGRPAPGPARRARAARGCAGTRRGRPRARAGRGRRRAARTRRPRSACRSCRPRRTGSCTPPPAGRRRGRATPRSCPSRVPWPAPPARSAPRRRPRPRSRGRAGRTARPPPRAGRPR